MKFVRERIDTLRLDALRSAGARAGWLLETSAVIRVGLGRAPSIGFSSTTDWKVRLTPMMS
jgi:hypothetical protein